ncbi:L,D-transpeptidase family protein [Clostridium perfringens]|uniref:L,D-transpeptidase family protein n=1 Tax=Clostridium perfringens TaxID=1502 RepID=UPI000D71C119|nr:L,D-transpeptidase family protein [Clostridium perfringens]EGT4141177.1 cell wall-binding protein [Clostridium perfringens]MBO3304301.1 L,D-transpeptidase family protein [Clostridium perfringens]MBO3307621.1 L,D-transpeptidase family protein [Clostridium perfringens]MBO3310948.1 L,D-transpeptidase family protein [Clostridium perfringens]MBO3317255.1 L,D-transpeptidase family protein [Clostridium perfringens]
MKFTKRKIKLFSLTCAITTLCSGFVLGENVQAANNKEWKFENNKWSYVDSNNLRSKDWENIKGDWFYFNSKGEMEIGWKYINKTWYHLRENGVMDTGWRKINGDWYYFNNSGSMMTGWQNINGSWYHLRDNGVVDIGWRELGGAWYHLNESGAMENGWKYINNEWYHLNENGPMDIGWKKINNDWYYFNNNGGMKIGWQNINDTWYHLKENGVMDTKWNKINDYWYYFNDDGKMINNQYIDGWRIDNNGVAHYEKAFRNPKLENSNQIIVVTTNNMSTSYCNIEIYEKNDSGEWNNIDSTTGRVGANGLAYIENRVQSTNTTPAGVMSITGAFGVKNNPGTKLDYIKVNNNMYWDLNSENSTYNRLINYNPGGDYEHLISYPRQYEYSLITDYNHNQVPNKGGAIFVHCLGRGATGGCVSMPREKMIEILKWIDPKKNPKILVIPKDDLDDYWY